MSSVGVLPCGEQYAAKGNETPPFAVSLVVHESGKRSRAFGADPFRACSSRVDDEELRRRRERRSELREVALTCIQNQCRIAAGTVSLIALGDEDCVPLYMEADESIRTTGNFRSEGTIGVVGMGTSLSNDQPAQIQVTEHFKRFVAVYETRLVKDYYLSFILLLMT